MADRSGPTMSAGNKLSMSKALGAAFLNHQVEQLEKSVSNNNNENGSWRERDRDRDRRQPQDYGYVNRRGIHSPNDRGGKRVHNHGTKNPWKKDPGPESPQNTREREQERVGLRIDQQQQPRRTSDEQQRNAKDADIVVVDSSVLVHALYQVKKWCKDGREEILVVPLEALNTLDLLKKGTTPLAQRARAASRILEAQVGTNSRIRVQRDDAFVLWDKITFKDTASTLATDGDKPASLPPPGSSPEWVRRTICCARWEFDNAETEAANVTDPNLKKKVLFAVLATNADTTIPQSHQSKRSDGGPQDTVITSPVPLPAPNPHANKFEPRTAGALVHHWASCANIEMMEVQPSAPGANASNSNVSPQFQQSSSNPRVSSEDERPSNKRQGGGRGRKNSQRVSPGPGSGNGTGGGLVERPPAVMAMMEMVSQPSKVVRLLARGEKLDPDP